MIKVLKFSAVWCGPCRALKPTFDQVRTLIADVVYEEIDVDNDPSATIKYNVHSVPTIVIEKNGQEVFRTKGAVSAATLTSAINSNR
jgi:thioredoxin 1